MYTSFDLEVPENQQMVNMVFMTQSYADIHRKLQNLEGFSWMNATHLLEVANKVFVN
jgi:virulence-associated protein VapD